MGKEKRKAERLPSKLFVQIKRLGGDLLGRGVVLDLSKHGMGIQTEAEISVNDRYEFDIEIPLTLKGQVVRQISSGQIKTYGIQLTDMGFITRFFLKRLLAGRRSTQKIN